MKGSIRQRTKGKWELQVYTGMIGPDGKPTRHYETVRGGKKDAQARMNELLTTLDKGAFTPPGKLTVGELLQRWLEGYVKTNCSQRTFDGYQSIIRNHLIPALGYVRLKELHHQMIQNYYAKAGDKLQARTIHHHHRVLSQALKHAVRQGYLGRNPAELVYPPSPRGKPMRTLNPDEVEIILEVVHESYFYPIIYTAVSTGLRQAELLGLRWRDVDLDMLSISVNRSLYKRAGICEFKEPKSSHSRRRVAMTPKLATFLRQYKQDREEYYRKLERDFTADTLVFATKDDRPIDPSVLGHSFNRCAKRAGLEGVRFHDLRHTFASLMLLRGAKPKVISEALGHASVGFTMDVYSHIIEGMQADAMSLLDQILPEGNNGCSEKNHGKITAKLDIKAPAGYNFLAVGV